MKISRRITQVQLSCFLALYIGLFLNCSVFWRRLHESMDITPFFKAFALTTEVFATVLASFFVLRLFSLGGRRAWQVLSSFLVLCSVAASYYMAVMNITIGYGIIASVMTTDIDLTKEVVGWRFYLWVLLIGIPPLWFIWRNQGQDSLIRQLSTRREALRHLGVLFLVALVVWAPVRLLGNVQKHHEKGSREDLPSYGGVVTSAYLPANWLSSLGLYVWAKVDETLDHRSLINPATRNHWNVPANLNDVQVVFIIGETTRWDHMGLFGYSRNTTPKLAQEKNLAAFRGESCDTATKLSLRCMFVGKGGVMDNPQRTLLEQNVFAVLKQLGFSSDLYAMQSEMWFYSNTMADTIAWREQIGAEGHNQGKTVDDMLLVDEMVRSQLQHAQGKHLVILHTKGSHYSYVQRYPREFAIWQPECMGVNKHCSAQTLINAYDNSVRYVDSFISSVIDQVRDKNAIVFYAADHGESISDSLHLHGTPRNIAPPEQFRVPLLVWASDKFLQTPENAQRFGQLQQQATEGVVHKHTELFDSVLGCLGITSPDGGIDASRNWCALQNTKGKSDSTL